MSSQVPMTVLGRTGRSIARLIWDLAPSVDDSTPLDDGWLHISADAQRPPSATNLPPESLVVGVSAAELLERRGAPFQERLAALGVDRCEAVLLHDAAPGDVKAGGPFHRLNQFRDRGIVQSFFIDAPDYPTAEWMLHHSPAHAVCLPFGLSDLSAKFRLLEDARNFGTVIIARPVEHPAWNATADLATDLSFILGESGIASLLVPAAQAHAARLALNAPMPPDQRDQWWRRYKENVAPPPQPIRNLPPEFGA